MNKYILSFDLETVGSEYICYPIIKLNLNSDNMHTFIGLNNLIYLMNKLNSEPSPSMTDSMNDTTFCIKQFTNDLKELVNALEKYEEADINIYDLIPDEDSHDICLVMKRIFKNTKKYKEVISETSY